MKASWLNPRMLKEVLKITSLEKQKKRSWRTSIFINGSFWNSADTETVIELGLYDGQQFTADELEILGRRLQEQRAINRAVLLLSYRSRSVHELSDRLNRAGFSDEIIVKATDKLKQLGYLDDEAFAQSWVKNRLNSKFYGPRRVKQELKLKGLSDELISNALEENTSIEDEYEQAKTLAESKLSGYKGLEKNALFRRLSQFLLRRGYNPEVVYDVCKDVL